MDLYKEILIGVLQNENISISFPQLQIDAKEIVEMKCYHALQNIKLILQDEALDDKECFAKIEEIICVFEENGSEVGTRHDFV
ncbi:MAG: hypothetical protein EOM30_01815 [Clostridia bacterium]|nr:hypothetical protein [Clostridia bacterium]NLS86250.1 hypothetical protein [Oscillospiraceae bacterium]